MVVISAPVSILHVNTTRYGVTTNTRCFKKNQTTHRPSAHPPVSGEKMSKRLGGIKRLQIQNLFMAFKQVPRRRSHWVHNIMSGRNPPVILYIYINRHAGTPENH